MGQQDPLVAWQSEGYEMFGQMMAGIDDDYVRYVMRAQVQVLEQVDQAAQVEAARMGLAEYIAQDQPVQGDAAIEAAAVGGSLASVTPGPVSVEGSASGSAAVEGAASAAVAGEAAPPAAGPGGGEAPGNGAPRKVTATVAGGGAQPTQRLEQGVAGRGAAPGAGPAHEAETPGPAAPNASGQVVRGEHEKLGRNEPCWCGSGRKFKLCHGR